VGVLFLIADEASLDDLIAAAQADPSNDSVAMNTILGRFEETARRIAHRTTGDPAIFDDAANGARLGLVKAVRAHQPGMPGFPSYATRFMRGEASRWARNMEARDIPLADDHATWLTMTTAGSMALCLVDFSVLVGGLDVDQRQLVNVRYIDDLPLKAIAGHLGVSISAVSQRFSTIHKSVRRTVLAQLAA
jgi:RNA polymerase sigma factor (sigma-70 family)